MRRRAIVLVAAVMLSACATSSVVDTAYRGDLAALKGEIVKAQKGDGMRNSEVRELARAVARREVRATKGDAAVRAVEATRPCVRAVELELAERARRQDDAGAAATLVLGTTGRLNLARLVDKYAESSSAAWRAVAARAAKGARHGQLRRAGFVDPDERVRRAALAAALESRDPDDVELLLEAARLDPDPMSRSLATRAAGASGTERAVLALRDFWPRASEEARLVIVEAWGQPAARTVGGIHQLLWAAETRKGLPAVAAAGVLASLDGEPQSVGESVLVRAVAEGSSDERRLAIRLVPRSADAIEALKTAAASEDSSVQVLALARLIELPKHQKEARSGLRTLAKGAGNVPRQARAALLSAGDAALTEAFVADLGAKNPGARRLAALGLARLGQLSKAATALGDDDPMVRISVACSILADAPRPL